jgi:hypothetical protein
MSNTPDWVPRSIDDFKIFGDNFTTQATTNSVAWGLDADEVANLLALQKPFNGFYDISKIKQSRTQQDTENTNNARVPYEKAIREMGQYGMKHNSLMTDANRTACGVPNDSGSHTPSPIAEIAPVIEYESAGRLGGKITALKPGKTRSHAKPEGQAGIMVKFGFYKQGDAVPAENACTQTELLSHSPDYIAFDENKFGMMFTAYARYINTRQQPGTIATMFGGVVS